MTLLHKTTPDGAPRPLTDDTMVFTITTGALDRDGDIINPRGWDTAEYMANPIVAFAHDYKSLPVARTRRLWTEGDALKAETQFPPRSVYPFADTVHAMVRAGFLTGASVGFAPGEYEPNGHGGKHFMRGHKLLEWSIVPIPSNPQAGRMPTTRAAAYDAMVKSFMGITDSRALRLQPHRVGLDEVRLKSFLASKSDQHPSQYCPKNLLCPSKAGQLTVSQCPARDCPMQIPTGKEAVFDIDLTDAMPIDREHLPTIREAMAKELRREAWAMSRSLIDDVVKPALRQHAMKLTGKLD